jgi:hypothetical protein
MMSMATLGDMGSSEGLRRRRRRQQQQQQRDKDMTQPLANETVNNKAF